MIRLGARLLGKEPLLSGSPLFSASPLLFVLPLFSALPLLGQGCNGDAAAEDSVPNLGPQAPTILRVDWAHCVTSERSGDVYSLQVDITDPQGVDTVAGGRWALYAGEDEAIFETDVVCRDGSCYGTGKTTSGAPNCAEAETINHLIVVLDVDGNTSAPYLQEGSKFP